MNDMFLGVKLPVRGLNRIVSPVYIGPRVVERIVDHERWKGRPDPFNVQLCVRFRGAGPNSDGWYYCRQTLHCAEFSSLIL